MSAICLVEGLRQEQETRGRAEPAFIRSYTKMIKCICIQIQIGTHKKGSKVLSLSARMLSRYQLKKVRGRRIRKLHLVLFLVHVHVPTNISRYKFLQNVIGIVYLQTQSYMIESVVCHAYRNNFICQQLQALLLHCHLHSSFLEMLHSHTYIHENIYHSHY